MRTALVTQATLVSISISSRTVLALPALALRGVELDVAVPPGVEGGGPWNSVNSITTTFH